MSIEVLPNANQCNLDCRYCYEDPQRRAETARYDAVTFKARLRQLADVRDASGTVTESRHWVLFGGEPLAGMPLTDLEEILQIGYEQRGFTSIQTNGSLITDRHIELFAKYNTGLGISIDGPGPLNDARWVRDLDHTRRATARTETAIEALLTRASETQNPRLIPSLIVSLHRLNATPERLPTLTDWFRQLSYRGVRNCRLHFIDLDYQASEIALSTDELLRAALDLWEIHDDLSLKFDVFTDILTLLRIGSSGKTTQAGDTGYNENPCCIWHGCDPWNTAAVEAVMGDGTTAQCGRGSGNDGKNWMPAEGVGVPSVNRASGAKGQRFHERQLSLYVTPQEHGGCEGCRFWLFCLGQCPGSGPSLPTDPHGDWRRKTIYCDVLKGLFAEAERRLTKAGWVPLSQAPSREAIEQRVYHDWATGGEPQLVHIGALLRRTIRGERHEWYNLYGHGDHTDTRSV